MPISKKTLARLKILDDLLRKKYGCYSLDELTEEVNLRLVELGAKGVDRRTIERDIHFIEHDSPFDVNLERGVVDTPDTKSGKKHYIKYTDKSFSIFKKELSEDEKFLLRELLSLVGQFDGLPMLEGLENLRQTLKPVVPSKSIVSISRNVLPDNKTIFGQIFVAISQRQVIKIYYHTFDNPTEQKQYVVYPYQLREYNRRWFLVSVNRKDKRLRISPLDRIDKIEVLPYHYEDYDGDVEELFDDVVGITVNANEEVKDILFWVGDKSMDYVLTKPIHASQRNQTGETEASLRAKYPMLEGGRFFRIECKKNYELIRDLCSFGKNLLVLEPSDIQAEVVRWATEMCDGYATVRQKMS